MLSALASAGGEGEVELHELRSREVVKALMGRDLRAVAKALRADVARVQAWAIGEAVPLRCEIPRLERALGLEAEYFAGVSPLIGLFVPAEGRLRAGVEKCLPSEAAAHHGVGRPTIWKYILAGLLPIDADGMVSARHVRALDLSEPTTNRSKFHDMWFNRDDTPLPDLMDLPSAATAVCIGVRRALMLVRAGKVAFTDDGLLSITELSSAAGVGRFASVGRMTVGDAAKVIGVGEQQVLNYAASGKLVRGDDGCFSEADVAAFRRSPIGRPGRKRRQNAQ